MSADPLASSTTCVVCGDPTGPGLCSTACRRAAVVEREDNVRRYRRLRRGGGGVIGDALSRRNAELTEALLATATSPRDSATVGAEQRGDDRVVT